MVRVFGTRSQHGMFWMRIEGTEEDAADLKMAYEALERIRRRHGGHSMIAPCAPLAECEHEEGKFTLPVSVIAFSSNSNLEEPQLMKLTENPVQDHEKSWLREMWKTGRSN